MYNVNYKIYRLNPILVFRGRRNAQVEGKMLFKKIYIYLKNNLK